MSLADGYEVATEGLLDGGADVLMIETIFDTLNAKAAIYAIEQVFHRRNERWPVMISGTITDASGRTLSGQTSEAFARSVAPRTRSAWASTARSEQISCAPTSPSCLAGHPLVSRRTRTQGSPTRSASTTSRLRRWPARLGAGRKTVSSTSSVAAAAPPPSTSSASAKRSKVTHRAASPSSDSDYAGLEPLKLTGERLFINVGERTNMTGSARFRKLIENDDYETAEVARQQVEGGAQVIDINFDDALIDGVAAMTRFLNLLASEPDIAKLPFMIDSSRPRDPLGRLALRSRQSDRQLDLAERGRGSLLGRGT